MNNQEEINICRYCKWSNLHTCTDRSCEEAILAAEKARENSEQTNIQEPKRYMGNE